MTVLAEGSRVRLRRIEAADLEACAPHRYTLSIIEPLTGLPEVRARFAEAGFWTPEAGALAIEAGGRLVGTMQYYRSGPGMHGYEIGYILHSEDDRGKGYASDALRTFTGFFFASRPDCHQQPAPIRRAACAGPAHRCRSCDRLGHLFGGGLAGRTAHMHQNELAVRCCVAHHLLGQVGT